MLFPLESVGQSLISRPKGESIRNQVLDGAPSGEPIVLDFAGVRRASYSFVDELVGKLASMHQAGQGARVDVLNANDVIAFHVHNCLERRLGRVAAREHQTLAL